MVDTPNHDYNVPSQGTQDWHTPLNENFEEFDTDIELRDTESSLGSYTPTQGAKFLATDTGVVYVGDGQSWVARFALPGYDPSTAGRVTLSIDGTRALALGGEDGGDSGNVLAGHSANSVGSSVVGAVVGGGGFDNGNNPAPNSVTGSYSVVAGGRGNTASDEEAVVGGGEGNTASGYYATVAGGANNDATARGATIGGGGGVAAQVGNQATSKFSTIAGGEDSRATANYSTVAGGKRNSATEQSASVGGGERNVANGKYSTVGGGFVNSAPADYATVAGGGPSDPNNPTSTSNAAISAYCTVGGGAKNLAGFSGIGPGASHATVSGGLENTASGLHTTVSGGKNNTASGEQAMVPGGVGNTADGDQSFAAGRNATTDGFDGTFVWGDSSETTAAPLDNNSIVLQAGGSRSQGEAVTLFSQSDASAGVKLTAGSGTWTSLSSKTAKTNRQRVDTADALDRVDSLDIDRWEYETQDGVEHMGPMAEQFHETFGLGADPEGITGVDADGVALAAIQGLSAKLDERDERIDDLEAENAALRDRLSTLEDRVAAIEADDESAAIEDEPATAGD